MTFGITFNKRAAQHWFSEEKAKSVAEYLNRNSQIYNYNVEKDERKGIYYIAMYGNEQLKGFVDCK